MESISRLCIAHREETLLFIHAQERMVLRMFTVAAQMERQKTRTCTRMRDRFTEKWLGESLFFSHEDLEEQLTHLAPYLQAILDEERQIANGTKKKPLRTMRQRVQQSGKSQSAYDKIARRLYRFRNSRVGN